LNGLDAVIESVAFDGAGCVRVRDEVHAVTDRRAARALLSQVLYRVWYCHSRSLADDAPALVEALREANAARADHGGSGHRGTVPLWFTDDEDEVAPRASGRDPTWELFFVYGSTLESSRPRLRFYFHVSAAEAPALVRALTRRLERWQVPFRFKTPALATMYGRRDTAVLYVEWFRFHFVLDLVLEALRAGEFRLEDETPLFARRIAPGLAFAEDPGNGESFGGHRCRLVAEALLEAGEAGVVGLEARRRRVHARFEEEGVVPATPHLRFGTADPLAAHA